MQENRPADDLFKDTIQDAIQDPTSQNMYHPTRTVQPYKFDYILQFNKCE